MTKPIVVPNTFATATNTIPLSQLDSNFSTAYGSINDANTYSNYGADTGVANAYVVTLTGVTTTYTAGLRIQFKASNANTGASTLNVNGGGVKNITFQDGTALISGAIVLNSIVDVMYDGTQFLLMNVTGKLPITNGGTALSSTPSNGQLLIGNGTNYTLANITVSAPLSITNGAGSIALAASGLGSGDVIGPASSTDRAIAIYNGTGGKTIQNSPATVTSAGFFTSNGLTFPATQVSSSDVNTLDDYEEGTFTPFFDSSDIISGDITITYSAGSQKGYYRKIGAVVVFSINMYTTNVVVTGLTSAVLEIGGLPFANLSAVGSLTSIQVPYSIDWTTNAPSLLQVGGSSWTLSYKTSPDATTIANITGANLTTGAGSNNRVIISGAYLTAT